METTVIGDGVNVASRVASLSKMYKATFLCSAGTLALLPESQLQVRGLGPAKVKGRPKPVKVYEVLAVQSQEQRDLKLQTAEVFEAAQVAFAQGQDQVALPLIKQVLELNPADGPAQFFRRWMQEGPIEFVK